MRFNTLDRFSPGWWPTQEEVLEVNARSIISDCRALISGTLLPRTLGSFSETWSEYAPDTVRLRKSNAHDKIQRSQTYAGITRTQRRQRDRRITRMVELVMLSGVCEQEARERVKELLKLETSGVE